VIPWWVSACCLVGAATLLAWPGRGIRARRRAVIAGPGPVPTQDTDPAVAQRGDAREPRWWQAVDRLRGPAARWRAVLSVAILVGGAGVVAGGPVAGIAAAAYGGLVIQRLLRRRSAVLASRAARRLLDELCALAADLRAGLPPSVATLPPGAAGRTAELARAAVRLAERTGAPLADLVERIEADARAMDRGLASAEAQAAGARATAWLLAALPLGGIALGYGIGVDPVRILLHTPIGVVCGVGAIALQLTGLAWADRLSAESGRAA
jgi:hypothetical protein